MINILVTGAGRGIGKAIALSIAEHYSSKKTSVNLAICSRTSSELSATCSAVNSPFCTAHPYICDLGSTEAITAMVETIHRDIGAIDILINNAGISYIGLLQDMSASEIAQVIDVNLKSAITLSSLLIPDMLRSQNTPRIINISSVWGNVGASCEVVYSATKGGLNSFTRALAKELAPSRIPVNAIACGYIDTEMNNHLSDEEREELFREIPMGRPGSAKEIGQSVCLLLDATEYMTGQVITIDGGWC